jgi:hypothetical protein
MVSRANLRKVEMASRLRRPITGTAPRELAQYVSEENNPEIIMGVVAVEIFCPSSSLEAHF